MSNVRASGEPTAAIVGANPYNTYGLATQGFVWAAISSVSGNFDGRVKTVNGLYPDGTGNVNVTSIRMEDYSGDVNEIRADLTVLSGDVEYRLLTNVDYSQLKTYTDNRIGALSGEFKGQLDEISSASGGWNQVESKVEGSSGDWDNSSSVVQSTSGNWNTVYTTVSGASGGWESSRSTVESLSAGWTNTVTTCSVQFNEERELSYYTNNIENPAKGDILILKKFLLDNNADLFTYSSFSYNGTNWVPLAGHYDANGVYDAENVFFTKDLTASYAIGNITLDKGVGIVNARGKNLKEVFDGIFLKDMFPNTTLPSISLTANDFGSFESGTVKTPSYSMVYNLGQYTYGPTSTAAATAYYAKFNQETRTTLNGTFSQITLTDAMSSENSRYRLEAYAAYEDDSVTPVTNLGNEYPSGRIKAGTTAKKYSAYMKSYRRAFYGSLNTKDGTFNSGLVRGLGSRTSNYPVKGSTTLPLSYPLNAIRAVFAYPAAIGDAVSINDENAFDADIIGAFTKIVVKVNDASNANPIPYIVYYKDAANPNDKANTYTLHL